MTAAEITGLFIRAAEARENGILQRSRIGPNVKVKVTQHGLEGSVDCSTEDSRALCVQSRNHIRALQQIPGCPVTIVPGQAAFGENVEVDGLDRSQLHIGDLFRVCRADMTYDDSAAVFEVASIRVPCSRVDMKHGQKYGLKGIRHTILTQALGGWFFRVVKEGSMQEGDHIVLVNRNYPEWPLQRTNTLLYEKSGGNCKPKWSGTPAELEAMLALGPLSFKDWKRELERVVASVPTANPAGSSRTEMQPKARNTASILCILVVILFAAIMGRSEDPVTIIIGTL